MLTYQTELPYNPPVTDRMRQSAVDGILNADPYGYGQQGKDVYDASAYANASAYGRAAQKANTDYQIAQQKAQRQLALGGLGEMAAEQQRQNELMNKQSSLVYGTVGGLLGGLFD